MSDTPPAISHKLLREAITLLDSVLHYGSAGGHSGIGQSSRWSPLPPPPMNIVSGAIIADQYSIGMQHFGDRRAALDTLQAAGAIQFSELPTESAKAYDQKYRIQVLDMETLRTAVAEMRTPKVKELDTTTIEHQDTILEDLGAKSPT